METKDYLTNFYEAYDEEGRLGSKHGMVEYITTMKYIEKYLKPKMRILEIGAATGRYSHALAQRGPTSSLTKRQRACASSWSSWCTQKASLPARGSSLSLGRCGC